MVPYSVLSYKIATVPKRVSEQTDKMPLSILFYTKKQIGCASASLGTLITTKLKNCPKKYVLYIDSKCINNHEILKQLFIKFSLQGLLSHTKLKR